MQTAQRASATRSFGRQRAAPQQARWHRRGGCVRKPPGGPRTRPGPAHAPEPHHLLVGPIRSASKHRRGR
eukprot:scaffold22677_cov105-Isochrysis_galbana.AAC.2